MIASNASGNGTMAIGLSGMGAAPGTTTLSSLSCTSSALLPESGVKIESSALNRFQPMNLAQDAIGQIL
jgi:hypothetical protein